MPLRAGVKRADKVLRCKLTDAIGKQLFFNFSDRLPILLSFSKQSDQAILIFLLFTKRENNRDGISHLVNETKLAGLISRSKCDCFIIDLMIAGCFLSPRAKFPGGQFCRGIFLWGQFSRGNFPGEIVSWVNFPGAFFLGCYFRMLFSRGHFSGHRNLYLMANGKLTSWCILIFYL